MLSAALAQGKPIMVIAITKAAITQPNAIHKPPKTIQSRLRRREITDITTRRPTTRLTAGAGPATPVTAARFAGSRATTRRRRRRPAAPRLTGCGKTEQGSRSDSDPFTWGFGYVHGQNEFFRSLLGRRLCSNPVHSTTAGKFKLRHSAQIFN